MKQKLSPKELIDKNSSVEYHQLNKTAFKQQSPHFSGQSLILFQFEGDHLKVWWVLLLVS